MTKMNSVRLKMLISLMLVFAAIIALFNISVASLIDSLNRDIGKEQNPAALSQIILQHSTQLQDLLTIISILLVLTLAGAMYLCIRRITGPALRIRKALDEISAGNLQCRLPVEPDNKDGFWFPASEFNEMATRLEVMMAEVEATQEDLERQVRDRTAALNDANLKLEKTLGELKATQKQIIQTETQKSLIMIVAGFGHEINNPLTGILGCIDLMELKNEDLSDYHRKKIASIKTQAVRIKGIIDELNQLNPELDQTKFFINIANLLEKLIKIIQRRNRFNNIKFVMQLPREEIIIRGNHSSLWQVFEGIAQNATEAIMDRRVPEGLIKVELFKTTGGAAAIIRISDNGGGFENIDKAFEPFFTTRKRTEKKGIGLTIAYNIIREHGGNIRIFNTDTGAALEIELPIIPPSDNLPPKNLYEHSSQGLPINPKS